MKRDETDSTSNMHSSTLCSRGCDIIFIMKIGSSLSIAVLIVIAISPSFASAQAEQLIDLNIQHPICVAWVKQMMATGKATPPPVCTEPSPLGPVTGFCVLQKCKGVSAPGLGGGSSSLGGSLGGIVGQLLSGVLQKLMQPKPPEPPTTPPYPITPGELQCSISASVATSTATSTSYALSWLSNGKSATISPNVVPVVKPGDILDVPYYCITQTNPIVVVPVPAGTSFPKNCVNGSSIPSSGSRQV